MITGETLGGVARLTVSANSQEAWDNSLPTGLRFAEQWGIIGLSGFFLQGIQLSAAGISLSFYDNLTKSREHPR